MSEPLIPSTAAKDPINDLQADRLGSDPVLRRAFETPFDPRSGLFRALPSPVFRFSCQGIATEAADRKKDAADAKNRLRSLAGGDRKLIEWHEVESGGTGSHKADEDESGSQPGDRASSLPTGSPLGTMFRGRHDHTIDKKGRLSIPAGFRMEIQRISEKPPILTTDKGCLALYPYDRWEEFEAKLDAADSLQPEVQAITRFFLANAVEAPIDSQGRILIPRHLRKHASLDRDVTVSGMGKWIEIWGTSALDHELAQTYQNLDGMRNAVVGQGK